MIHAPAVPPGATRPPAAGPPVAGPPVAWSPSERIRGNIRLTAFALLLVVLPFVTAPGKIIADTKLDLVVNPVGFLGRALTLWDPQQFGQLQDQAYGYLFPMGPFFALGKLAAADPWVVQRLWIGAVLVTAFMGTVRLAGRLGIGTPWAQLTAGLAYALSPAALTLVGELSAEFLPAALLPWILLPLASVTRAGPPGDGDRRLGGRPGRAGDRPAAGWRLGRAAARSAAAVALCGGINAAATIAVLLPPAIYLLTLRRGAPRWRLLGWWVPAVVAATWWWSVPLLLLSKYAYSIVPYTESAAVTTSVTSLSDILRGTENWVSYLAAGGQPWWPLGFRIATGMLPTLATGLAAGLGLAGLVSRGLPSRRFLLCSLLAGVLLTAAGYRSSLGAPLAGPADQLINGAAAAFRNVRKFDPMIRLPLALGLAQLLAPAGRPQLPRVPWPRAWAGAAAGLAIAALALPAYLTGLAMPGAFSQVPPYWVRAADWLTAHAHRQAVLVVPGAPFSQYTWGSPLDDVLQPLTSADWAERDLSIIGSPGSERLLDAIDQRLAAGSGSAGLTRVLARMGVRYLVVRNDLDRAVLAGDWPARVHQALAAAPGITEVARFGRYPVGSFTPDDAVTNFDAPYPPVQIYRVAGTGRVASVQPAGTALRVYGAPESLLTLADEGLLGPGPALLNSDDHGQPAAAPVLTDSLRRRVRNFGELRTSYSPTLTAGQPAQTFEATSDYTEPGWDRYLSVARYGGIADVTASSSGAGIGAIPAQWASGLLPYAAVDGDPRTMWESGSWTGPLGQWIQLGFRSPVAAPVISVAFASLAALGPPVTQVVVSTAAGRAVDRVRITGRAQLVRVPPGRSRWLRITITGLAGRPSLPVGAQVGITGISVPGVRASRTIVAPARPPAAGSPGAGAGPAGEASPGAVVLSKAQPQPSACMRTSLRWVCSPALATPTEEQYGFSAQFPGPVTGRTRLRGSAVLIDPALIERYARLRRGHVWVAASSTYTAGPADQPWSAFDGDPATSWIASATDAHPTLHIRWWHARVVRRITIQRPPGASGLLQVLLAGAHGQVRGGMVGPSGVLRFVPLRTSKLTLTFTPLAAPLQISGVRIPGLRPLGTPSVPLRLRCGLGPLIWFNGKAVPTRVTGTFAGLLTGQPMRFTGCARLRTAAGANQVTEPSTDGFDVQDAVLAGTAARPPPTAGPGPVRRQAEPARVVSWAGTRRVLQVSAASRSYLVLDQNFNPGWQASWQGRRLTAARVDGWKQAWVLPAGASGRVTLTYRPQAAYRCALTGGLATLALVLLAAWWPSAWWPSAWWPGAGRRRARRPEHDAPPGGPRPARPPSRPRRGLTRLAAIAGLVVAGTGVVLAGFWLGGYPGTVILAAATGLFMVSVSYRHSSGWCRELAQPRVLIALLLAVAATGMAGESLLRDVRTGVSVSGAWNTVPQIICLIAIGRLAAALILPDP